MEWARREREGHLTRAVEQPRASGDKGTKIALQDGDESGIAADDDRK